MSNYIVEKIHVSLPQSPYCLLPDNSNADIFYQVLDEFAGHVSKEGTNRFGSIINEFQSSPVYLHSEFDLAPDECLLDLLILGTLWNQYNGRWGKNIEMKAKILNNLYVLRKSNPRIKPFVDRLRGKMSYMMLNPNGGITETNINIAKLEKLCTWLSATNEFNEEVKRIEIWLSFFKKLPERKVDSILWQVLVFASWFKSKAKMNLGAFTFGVNSFLMQHSVLYKNKEDFFFTGRSEVEYHLNMVGASVMNRSMKLNFDETGKKVLLLPSCMAKNNNCKAYDVMHGTVCAHCTKGCSISEASIQMTNNGESAYIVKHSSGFSKSLLRWANQKNVGLIGTACTLNLLAGGYEMKRLNIPAQCIFLDYSGCKKHWACVSRPTSINVGQLASLVGVATKKAV
ncbi:MAG: DUF116 domain-containing protein [Prolixibacteraceae bacterium]|nr:DUF116 domain-containing protein [Prolixibacteraceae bacterium]